MTPEARLAALEGEWTFRRHIVEAEGGTTRVTGRAVWTRGEDAFDCLETGTMMRPDGSRFEAARRTLWTIAPDGIAVQFADGRPFHRITGGARPKAAHDCPPDDYRLSYDFSRWPDWSVRWRVRGPRKDYGAVTTYRRA
ncbi:DUF6314 family protein [Jannaschia sp. KMU-145]|uniref:DUF6314 family protein n=1 Tax=Jannaschia halovivens TaxID=3388667 RepID=UPI00396B2661